MVTRSHSTSSRGSGSVTVGSPQVSQPTPTDSVFSEEAASDDEYDAAENLDDPVEGWPRVALLMAKTPDFAAFSRFRDLNIKSLLYYQAQLTRLRRRLHEEEYKDLRGGKKNFARRADFLMRDEDSEQFKLIMQLRKVLREYNEALLQYSQISALPEPESYNMKTLRKWLRHEQGGNFSIRGGGEQNTWGNIYEDPDANKPPLWKQFRILLKNLIWAQPQSSDDLNLVLTRSSGRIDGFTRWVAQYLIPFYEEFRLYREKRKADKHKSQARSDVEKDAKNTYCIPFYGELNRYKEKRKEGEVKTRTRSNSTPIPRPEKWLERVEKNKETVETWSENGILKFTSVVSTVIACLLPVAAITVLSQVHGNRNLLLCLAIFVVIFAVGLIFLTSGTSSRVEIFTATSAFSAVLVVFMSVPVVNCPYPPSSST